MTITIPIDDVVSALAFMQDQYDKGSERHAERTTDLSVSLGRAVGLGEEDMITLRRAALIHDLGKIAVGVNILNKPARLTDNEIMAIHQHPHYGYLFAEKFGLPRPVLEIIRCHHEYMDGSGYPRRLKGDRIPILARIITIADQYDALTQPRPNRAAYGHDMAVEILHEMEARFDPQLLDIFLSLHESGEIPSREE